MKRARWNWDHQVGPVLQQARYHAPDDTVTVSNTVPSDRLVAERVRELQASGTRLQGMGSFAGDHLCIPLGVWLDAVAADPELEHHDTATREAAIRRFYRQQGHLWRVNPVARYVRGGLTL